MKSNPKIELTGGALLPMTIFVIVLSLGALAWEWHNAGSSTAKHGAKAAHHHHGHDAKAAVPAS